MIPRRINPNHDSGSDSIRDSSSEPESERSDQGALLAQMRRELEQERAIVVGLHRELAELEDRGVELFPIWSELERERARARQYESALAEIQSSRSWQLVKLLSGLRRAIAHFRMRRRLSAARMSGPSGAAASDEQAATIVEHARDRSRSLNLLSETKSDRPPARKPVFLLISHRGGGGTERHIRELATALKVEGVRPVLVRDSGTGSLIWEERNDFWHVLSSREIPADRDQFDNVLRLLEPVHVHVHHVMGLPVDLLDWLSESGVSYDWTVHDYFAICPRAHLNRGDGSYCGEPNAEGCNRCLSRLGDRNGRPVADSITSWRDRFSRNLQRARRVFAPSDDVRRRLRRYFPDLPILLRPHFESLPDLASVAAPLRPGDVVRVAVLGFIVQIKGSETLLACARDALRRQLPLEFRIVGFTDRDGEFARLGNVHITGAYREREVFHRLRNERCHLAFLPSRWPETFMYTLSIALAARLFTVSFDLGAQAERLRNWKWSRVLPLDARAQEINDALLSCAHLLSTGGMPLEPAPSATYPDFLVSYYDFTNEEADRIRGSASRDRSQSRSSPHFNRARAHALYR
jgi:glycosyltransferase involved in cell wall biosynthesis